MKKLTRKTKLAVTSTIITALMLTNAGTTFAATTYNRLAGADRYATSMAIAQELQKGFTGKLDGTVIATGENFADALSAGPLASFYGSPLLLGSKNAYAPESQAAINFAMASMKQGGTAELIGGEGVLDPSYVSIITAGHDLLDTDGDGRLDTEVGFGSFRADGVTRYSTSLLTSISVRSDESSNRPEVLFVASGENFPDALSVASQAGIKKAPILLTPSDNLPDYYGVTIKNYRKLDAPINGTWYVPPTEIVIVGGEGVISANVESQLKQLAPSATITRLAGVDRYETAAQVYAKYFTNPSQIYIASGENFPDALSASPLAAKNNAPVVLVDPNSTELPPAIESYLKSLNAPAMTVLGGEGVISNQLADKILNMINLQTK